MESFTEGNRQDSGTSGLDAWLARATDGLCPQAKERVWREIITHSAEAEEDLRVTGVLPDVAEAQALDGLGDATTANKALRKAYLTGWQQRLLAGLSQPLKPINARDYGWLVFLASSPPVVVLLCVCLDYRLVHTDHSLWLASMAVTLFFCLGWLAIAGLGLVHAVDDSLQHWHRSPLHARPTAMNRLYPWSLMACIVCLFAIWRIRYTALSAPEYRSFDCFMLIVGGSVAARMHRILSVCLFVLPWRHAWARTGLVMSFVSLLLAASLACVLWRPSWSVITTFLVFKPNSDYPFISTTDIYGMFGVALAVVLLVVAVRWTIGLYLLRKEVSGDISTEPASFPETPFGE